MAPRTPPTRAERNRRGVTTLVFLLGLLASWWAAGGLANVLAGGGWAPPRPRFASNGIVGISGGEKPVTLVAPPEADTTTWAVLAAVFGFAVAVLVARVARRGRVEERHSELAGPRDLRNLLGAHAVRRAARWTRPDLSWWQRRTTPLAGLGYHVGRLRGTRHDLWAGWETRIRIIARTGWGKTNRLLVRIVRDLPGAALVGTTKVDLFAKTVRARQAVGEVWVVDFSDADNRFAAGFPRVQWSVVRGCRDYAVALRRGRALAGGTEDGDREDGHDGFFRDAAATVIAGWLHAADLPGVNLSMDTVLHWQQNITLRDPFEILRTHPSAERAALIGLEKHLDPRSERTTSSTERFIQSALAPFATRDGQEFAEGPFDIAEAVRRRWTVYLLASPATAGTVSPLLTLFADEWFHVARAVAIADGGPEGRHPVPVVGVLDELRGLVPIPSLPQVAYEMRSYGIGLVYSVQNAAQEEELYGRGAETLAQNVQLTIVGGHDESIADRLTAQAGEARTASVNVSGHALARQFSEGGQYREAITAADQQKLRDGDSVMRMAGAPLFFGRTKDYRQDRRLARAIRDEVASVTAETASANAVRAAEAESRDAFAQATYVRPSHLPAARP